PVVETPPTLATGLGAANIAGLNWADPRDNFTDDALVLSGLGATDDYATVQTKTERVINGFQASTSANTVRLPINPPTVLGNRWTPYTGAIDKALGKGMKVILACWESNSSRNGRIDDATQFNSMWQTVVAKYGTNANVYFEVFNEPHGYSLTELSGVYADWLSRNPGVPQSHVLLDGEGYAQNITGIGADSRFSSCLLSIHLYDFFYNSPTTTAASWENAFAANLGSYASRAVLTEWGTFMATGVNYYAAIDNDVKKSYVLGISNYCRQKGIASVYWPGLRTGDQYSLLQFDGTNTGVTNPSGLGRVQFGWGIGAGGTNQFYPTASYRLINRNSGQVMDVNGASKNSMAPVIQYYQNGDQNQQWQLAVAGGGYYTLTNRNSSQLLDVMNGATTAATPIVQNPANATANSQQWQLAANADGYYKATNRNSSLALDVSNGSMAAATPLVQAAGGTANSQQWLIWQQ
ncbi:RICIN domain-containing protein, partial [Hymenobacter agri]